MSGRNIRKWDEVHGMAEPEPMRSFLESTTDSYAILQLRRDEDTAFELFASMRELDRLGLTPDIDHYEVVYVDRLPAYENKNEMLEGLYVKFNVARPEDFTGHSLSVSDIVAVKKNGQISCHYVDSFGFRELQDFLKPENYLKNAEVGVEDDYNMIDGIVNNGRKDEPQERPSVLEKLREEQAKAGPAAADPPELPERGDDAAWKLPGLLPGADV